MSAFENRIPPPIIGILAAVLMWGVSSLGPSFSLAAQFRWPLVAVLVLIGISFDVLGILAFRKSRTTVNPLKPENASSLVVDGVYRITRNPMYVGMGFLLLAWAVHLSAWLPFAVIPLFVLILSRFQIVPEERMLRRIFGEDYEHYTARVRRWL
ncbi:MAG TPA: isoprenylcysteine carboxylmethyltransferase family protein [Dokdonella sp.]|uniref:methyltransferase family protein n=1 Tax=Dokdonella sp. TaxID=2291710 RepID=UPI002D80A02B|nr:isoprenylcysteine carboxylmethyltransferase family protein [Dokdonella sp.]HET9031760.1 isoprenylcysteine carboxylmethyltransferase family protein [Dokdonella sp.]